jgi:hypothetical protein
MKPSVILAILIGIIALVILSGCAGGSDKDNPSARATEASKHVDGSDSLYMEGMEYNLAGRASESIDEAIQNYQLSIEKTYRSYTASP